MCARCTRRPICRARAYIQSSKSAFASIELNDHTLHMMWEEVESKNRWACSYNVFDLNRVSVVIAPPVGNRFCRIILAIEHINVFNKWQRERRGAEMRVETRVRRSGTSISWNGTGNERLWTLYNERLLDRQSWNLEPERMGRREANGKSEIGDYSSKIEFLTFLAKILVNFRWCATRFLNRFVFGWAFGRS